MPSTASTVVVPSSVAPLGLDASESVTAFVAPGTALPSVSCTATCTGGDIVAPTWTLAGGCTTNARVPLVTCPAGDQLAPPSSATLFVIRVGADPSEFIT